MSSEAARKVPVDPAELTPKGRRTRRAILEAALELFAESGTNAVSLRAIAGAAGISLAGLLRYFPDRDELVVASLRLRDVETVYGTLGHDSLSPEDLEHPGRVFEAFVDAVRHNEERPGALAVFSKVAAEATSPDHVAHPHFRERYARIRAALDEAFAAHFALTGSTSDPAIAATSLMALSDGLQIQWLLDPVPGELVRPIVAFLALHGIVVDPDVAGDRTDVDPSTRSNHG